MAITKPGENRGGANGGPQYNPANISNTGGAGGSGKQALRYIPDMKSLGSTGTETMAQQKAVPMSKVEPVENAALSNFMSAVPPTQLYSRSERTNEPVTSGINIGDGVGANSLMMTKSTVKLSDTLEKMIPFDTTGEIIVLYQDALSRGN
jgi:hypothetical protein